MRSHVKPIDVLRYLIGYVFLLEGTLKWIDEDVGLQRFIHIGIPYPELMVLIVGSIEVVCGSLLLFNLYIKKAIIPLLLVMVGAINLTKIPILIEKGFFWFAHESRLDIVIVILLLVLWKSYKNHV